MGFQFQKSINLGGGMRLNISKSGLGVSAGVKGLRVGIGPRGTRVTATIPKTGIRYVKTFSNKKAKNNTLSTYLMIIVTSIGELLRELLSNSIFNVFCIKNVKNEKIELNKNDFTYTQYEIYNIIVSSGFEGILQKDLCDLLMEKDISKNKIYTEINELNSLGYLDNKKDECGRKC